MNNSKNPGPSVSQQQDRVRSLIGTAFGLGGRALLVLFAAQVVFSGCAPSSFEEQDTGAPRAPAVAFGTRNGIPTVTLSDGKRVVLDRLEVWDELRAQFPAPSESAPDEEEGSVRLLEQRIGPKSDPSRVDLRDGQTAIRDQGGRGTCVAHATSAALEAAYVRERGVTLDLSEQYANHVQKMTHLDQSPKPPTERETQLGAWGGSNLSYQLGWLFRLRFGLPEEDAMAGIDASAPSRSYIASGNYELTDQDGDEPRMSWSDETLSQRAVDAWNLSATPMPYSIPSRRILTNFPRNAPGEAVYGVARVREVSRTLNGIRDELAAGREVAIGVSLTGVRSCVDSADAPLPEGDSCYDALRADEEAEFVDGIWHPLEAEWGAHAMLIVGYDDALEAFIVKNSWGTDETGRGRPVEAAAGERGFIYMSYDWVDRIHDAFSVLETRDPSAWLNHQPYLGKWHVETDLSLGRADLAVYHLPEAFPRSALSGRIDKRLGTLHASDRDYRVNGSLGFDRLIAHFGSPAIDASYDVTRGGTRAVALRIDENTLAGWTHPAGDYDTREPFFATIGDYPPMQFARETTDDPAPLDFFGSWRVVGAGFDGVLEFVDDIRSGTYTPSGSGGAIEGVELEINPRTFITDPDDPCFVRITVPTSPPTTLDGLLFCSTSTSAQRALITGIGDETGVGDESGFYAYRERRDPAVIIQSPTDGSVASRGRQRVELRARTVGFTEAPVIRWTSDIDGFLGESASWLSRFDLSFGNHVITASTAAPGGGTLTDTVELTIANDPPVVDIVSPGGGERFCADEGITFLATSRDLNNRPATRLPESAIEWSVAGRPFVGTSVGTGHSLTASFPEGGYTIVVRATDDQGAFAEDSIKFRVETCPDTPPRATILFPEMDSGSNEAPYAYDGYDDARELWYTEVTFVGTGQDLEDGALSGSSLLWTTNRTDLQSRTLGTGRVVTVRLYSNSCAGTWHDVQLTVTDSRGNKRSALRRIFVWSLC